MAPTVAGSSDPPDGSRPTPGWLVRLPALALFVLAPLLADGADPWLTVALCAAGAASALALVHPAAGPAGLRGLQLAALAALPVAAALWNNVDAGAARSRLVDLALCLVALRAARDLLGRRRRTDVALCLSVVGGLTGAHGLYQRAAGFPRALEALAELGLPEAAVYSERLATGRVFSTFLLPSTFAGFLLISLPLTAWLMVGSKGTMRAALVASASVQVAALFLTYSHGAWAALAGALAVVATTAPSRKLRRASLGAAALAALLLIGVMALRGERIVGPGSGDDPISERLGNWKVAARQIADHPVAGVGWGGYGAAYTLYQEAWMNQARHAHNSYLQIVAEGGLVTIPFVVLLLGSVGGRLFGSGRRADDWGFNLALVATLLHNAFDFTLFRPAVAVPFVAVLGAVAAVPRIPAVAPRLGRAISLGLALALVAAGMPAALGAGQAVSARAALLDGRPAEGLEHVRAAVRLDPWTAEYRDFLARWWLDHGDGPDDLARARRGAEEACRLAPLTPHHRTTLEMVCLAQGDAACAYRAAARAASLFPSSAEYRARWDALTAALEAR